MNVAAQDVAVGVKGGLNIPNITPGGKKTPLSEGYSSRMAWGAGVFAEVKFTPTFSLVTGLEYSGQGGKKNGNQAMPTDKYISGLQGGLQAGFAQMVATVGQASAPGAQQLQTFGQALNAAFTGMQGQMPEYLYADYNSVARFNYLMLPVQARFGWNFSANSPWRVYVQAGLFGSYMFDAEREMSGSSQVYLDAAHTQSLGAAFQTSVIPMLAPAMAGVTDQVAQAALTAFLGGMGSPTSFDSTQDLNDEIKRFNFGFIGAAGISYNFGHAMKHSVFIEGGGNYGFIKIQKNDANGQNRIGAGTVMLGYSYTIRK